MRITELMTADVATVGPEATLKEVASALAEHRVSGLPVVDRERRVLGVVSETDIVDAGSEPGRRARTAGEAMTSPAITIDAGRRVAEAARLMTGHRVNRLPVLNDGLLVGIVTRADLVRAYTRSDEDLQREIEDDVLPLILMIPEGRVRVSVDGGTVVLAGQVDSRSEAELLARFVEQVPGVVEVRSTVSWFEEDPGQLPIGRRA